MSVRAVFGVALYGDGAHLEEAIDSLLGQRFDGLAFVMADDGLTPEARARLDALVDGDPRVLVTTNERRLGLLRNWHRVFELARREHPDAEFFAWGSDHDIWHPAWTARLVEALDADPGAVAAYPRNWEVDEDGEITRMPWTFAAPEEAPEDRVRATSAGMSAGNMVYALYRADHLQACGVYRGVLLPDRLLMLELAARGRLIQLPDVLWHRRRMAREGGGAAATIARQRANLFPEGEPWWARLPWWLLHLVALTVLLPRHGLPRRAALALAVGAGRDGAAIVRAKRRMRRQKRRMRWAKRVRRVRKRVVREVLIPFGARRRAVDSKVRMDLPRRVKQAAAVLRGAPVAPGPAAPSPALPAGSFHSREPDGVEAELHEIALALGSQTHLVASATLRLKRTEAALGELRGEITRRLGAQVRVEDPEFVALAEEVHADQRTLLTLPRLYTLWSAARNVAPLGLAAAEIGTFRGGSARFIALALRHFNGGEPLPVHAFDTFEGHPGNKITEHDPGHEAQRFSQTSASDVRAYLADVPGLEVHVGEFSATVGELAEQSYGLVHIDTDLYEPTIDCLEYFAPRLALGGVMVVDDFGAPSCPGVDEAVREFVGRTPGLQTWPMLTEQVLVQRQ